MKVIFKDVVKRANTKEDRFNTEKIYYVGGEHIHSNELLINERGIIKGSTIGPMFYFGFKAGQVLFVTRNPHLRKAAMVEFDGICSEKTLVLETMNPSVLSQDYLPIIMQSDNFWHYCEEHKSGGVNYFINWSTLADYEFELPSLEEQHSHSQKIWAAYRLRESYKKLLAATDEMVKSQFIDMFKNIPSVKIADCCITVSGGTPNTKKIEYYDGGDIPWLSSGEINQGYIFSTDKYITQLGLENSSAKWVPANSVVIAMYGATAGKVGFIKIPLTTNQAVCTLLPNDGFEPLYLYYATLSKTSWMISQCRGAAQPNISQSIIRSMEIPMATIDEQKQFCKLLTQADKSKFGDFKSQFIEMFGNPVNNSKSWPTKAIMEVAPEQPSKKQMPGKVWLLNLDMIESNTGKVIEKVYEISDNTLSVQPFDEDNVLFSKLRPYLNKVVVPDEYGLATTELVPLRPNQEVLNKVFLSYLLRSQQFVTFANKISGGTKMPRMPLAELRNFKCILPPMSEQLKFVSIAKQADKSKFELKQCIENIDKVIKSLING